MIKPIGKDTSTVSKMKRNWLIILKRGLLGLVVTATGSSILSLFLKVPLDELIVLRDTAAGILMQSLIPLFFLSLVNVFLAANKKSLASMLVTIISIVIIVALYKYLPVNGLINSLILISFIIPVVIPAITRVANIGGGYKELITGAIFGYFIGLGLLVVFYTLFLLTASLFIDVMGRAGHLGVAIMTFIMTAPLGFIFWFSISLAEQIYLRKQKAA